MGLHINYCKGFGVTVEEIEASEESQGMLTFIRRGMPLIGNTSLYCIYKVAQC
jgi:hypothetical protein